MHHLPQATVATDVEVLALIERQQLFGIGIGYVDAHLLAAAPSVWVLSPAAAWFARPRARWAATLARFPHRSGMQ